MNLDTPPAAGFPNYYRVCGLRIGSAIPFPELGVTFARSSADPVDIELVVGSGSYAWNPLDTVMSLDDPDEGTWLRCTRTIEGYRFNFPELADFLVDGSGGRVICLAQVETPPKTIRHLFLDQVLPLLLNLRGREALHASAIGVAGGACAFMGMSGQGKSTLAAAFQVAGHRILSDDCLVLKDDSDRVLVEPAYPGLRLWDDSRDFIFGESKPSQPVSHYNDKRRIATPEPNTEIGETFELHGIYSLLRNVSDSQEREPAIERLSVRDALMELISFAFRLDLTDQAMILRQMHVLERVARRVPVKRLRLPDDLAAIPQARALILQDLQRGQEKRCE